MTVLELHLDEQTIERVHDLAARRHSTIEALIIKLVKMLAEGAAVGDPLLGMFAQEPELLDVVLENAMMARETDPLRLAHG